MDFGDLYQILRRDPTAPHHQRAVLYFGDFLMKLIVDGVRERFHVFEQSLFERFVEQLIHSIMRQPTERSQHDRRRQELCDCLHLGIAEEFFLPLNFWHDLIQFIHVSALIRL